MAGGAGLPASWADVLALLQAGPKTNFTTTTPAGSGWIRFLLGGALVQIHFMSTGNVSAGTTVTLDYTLPAAFWPSEKTALHAASSTTTKLAASVVDGAGAVTFYNGHSSSAVAYIDGIYAPA